MEPDMHQALTNMAAEQGIPPSFHGNPLFYMMAIFGLLTMTLLAANWLWRVCWCMAEDPHPLKTPVTLSRIVIACLMTAALLRGTPDAILLLRWPELSAHARLAISETDRFLDGVALIPFTAAWFLDYFVGGVVQFKLKQLPPPPVELWPQMENLKRPVKIAAGSLVIAFAVVFLQ